MNTENYDGWILYYSEEGYPYYYNEKTGDSQWADYQDSNEQQYQGHANPLSEELTENDTVFHHENINIGSFTSHVPIDENGSEEENSGSSVDSSVEEKFEMYLETEEGQAEFKLEQERITKRLEKRRSRESLRREKLYILSLRNAKKETEDIPSSISSSDLKIFIFQLLGSVRNFFGVNQSFKAFNDKSAKDVLTSSAGTALQRNFVDRQLDEFGREKNRRLLKYSNDNVAISPRMIDADPILDSNPSSDSESQLSSDDSDVEIINAPLLAELPTWKSAFASFLLSRWQPQVWPTVQNLASIVLAVLLKILVMLQAIQTFLNPFALRLLRLLAAKDTPRRPAERAT